MFAKAAIALGFKQVAEPSADFLEHIATHGISYGTQEEYLFREQIFNAKTVEYAKINADPENTFTVGHNFMSTWTHDEYKKLLGFKAPNWMNFDDYKQPQKPEPTVLEEVDIPATMDWRTQGAVNPVKNQAQCGSCWAFSATSAIEGHKQIKDGKLYSLSEQELVSCDTQCAGCGGGWQSYGMEYVAAHGQVTEADYPYTSGTGQSGTCQQRGTPVATVKSVNTVKRWSSSALLSAIAQGPVSVTVEADTTTFQGYTGGIMNSSACGTSLDHAITAVGYGEKDGQKYYIVRNSWGPTWGDAGYINIATQDGWFARGICGIQQTSVWPTMA